MPVSSRAPSGPLAGVHVLEIGGMGPTPFVGMLLAELGADVVRVERPGGLGVFPGSPTDDLLNRGKRSVVLDLKQPRGVEVVLTLASKVQIVIEGHRPGVAERLGIGPEDCWSQNPALVYGRMTGWGQNGPLANAVGHDVNYIALTGALHAIGPAAGLPQIPLNLVGDFGGGGMYLVVGVLAALREAEATGHGQVVDAAIVDGVTHLLANIYSLVNTGTWTDQPGQNLLDGGAPFYSIYETADGRHVAVGAIEPKFYAALLAGLELAEDPATQNDPSTWAAVRDRMQAVFRLRSLSDWLAVFDGTDACVAPVLRLHEAAEHPHMRHRSAVTSKAGRLKPGRAPRFSAHPEAGSTAPPCPGEHTHAVLAEAGLDPDRLIADGVASAPST